MIYEVVNILDLIKIIGETETRRILLDFECPLNEEVEYFIHNNAIDFAKRKISVTFLVFNDKGALSGIFTLAHKAIEIDASNLSKETIKRLTRFAYFDETSQNFSVSAFLIGQFGKNYNNNINADIDGNVLMNTVFEKLVSVQHEIGGGIVYLDCENKSKLLEFYSNNSNNFRKFGEYVSNTDNVRYIQMMKFF